MNTPTVSNEPRPKANAGISTASWATALGIIAAAVLLNLFPSSSDVAEGTGIRVVRNGFPLTFREAIVSAPGAGEKIDRIWSHNAEVIRGRNGFVFSDGEQLHFEMSELLKNILIAVVVAFGVALLIEQRKKRTSNKDKAHDAAS